MGDQTRATAGHHPQVLLLQRFVMSAAVCAALGLCPSVSGQCEVANFWASDPAPQLRFGWKVDTTPDLGVIVVGANGRHFWAGAAYVLVFDRQRSQWVERAILTAPDPGPVQRFGEDVAISTDGRTIVVGEVFDNDAGNNAGAVFVFIYDVKRDQWQQAAKLLPTPGGGNGCQFMGYSVALSADGTRAVAGANAYENERGLRSGAAYVFDMRGDGWTDMTQTARLVPPDGREDVFGFDVAISADRGTIIAGSPAHYANGIPVAGAVYVYRPDEAGKWVFQQKLTASDGQPFDQLGESVTTSEDGTTIIAGAAEVDGELCSIGAAYVFRFDSESQSWIEEQKVMASPPVPGDSLGRTVDISADGNTALLSTNDSKVYVFVREDSTWTEQAQLARPIPGGGGSFGWSTALTPDASAAVIGSGSSFVGRDMAAGMAYVFDLTTPCPGDLDGDGSVGASDLLILLVNWGPCADCDDCIADIDGDCTVGAIDLLILLVNWG